MQLGKAPVWCGLSVLLGVAIGVGWTEAHLAKDVSGSVSARQLSTRQEQVLKRLEALEAGRLRAERLNQAEQALARVAKAQPPPPRTDSPDAMANTNPEADAASPPALAAEEPSPEQLLGGQQAQELLQRAVQIGKWDDRDRSQFRAQFRSLTSPQQAELVRQLNVALNEGKLPFDPAAPPI